MSGLHCKAMDSTRSTDTKRTTAFTTRRFDKTARYYFRPLYPGAKRVHIKYKIHDSGGGEGVISCLP